MQPDMTMDSQKETPPMTDAFAPGNADLSRNQTRRRRPASIGSAAQSIFFLVGVLLTIAVLAFSVDTVVGHWGWSALYGLVPVVMYLACRSDRRLALTWIPVLVVSGMFLAAAVSIGVFAVIDANVWCLAAVCIALLAWPPQLVLLTWRMSKSSMPVDPIGGPNAGIMTVATPSANQHTDLVRNDVSADRAYDVIHESEPDGRGGSVLATTIFLTASECPVGCSMCDLWQNTLTTATPVGAIPRQITEAIETQPSSSLGQGRWIKLYNSGNFFDRKSIPPADYRHIAKLCQSYDRVVVENHPKIGRSLVPQFRDLIDGQLEIAVGLETVHPRWLQRMNKQMNRDDFDRFADQLAQQSVDLRVFLIFGFPSGSVDEAIRWTRLSAQHAAWAGARHVSLIPARPGNGWAGHWNASSVVPSISDWERCQQSVLSDIGDQAVVTVDLWNGEEQARSLADRECLQRLQQRNVTQRQSDAIAKPGY